MTRARRILEPWVGCEERRFQWAMWVPRDFLWFILSLVKAACSLFIFFQYFPLSVLHCSLSIDSRIESKDSCERVHPRLNPLLRVFGNGRGLFFSGPEERRGTQKSSWHFAAGSDSLSLNNNINGKQSRRKGSLCDFHWSWRRDAGEAGTADDPCKH